MPAPPTTPARNWPHEPPDDGPPWSSAANPEWPRISVVTPSYNQGEFLENAILSVLNQQYPDLEYIIIDGGSSDNSVDVIRKYADRISYWSSEPDRGQSHAINKGLARCSGQILAWLNSDDMYLPGALHRIAAEFARQPPDTGALVGKGILVDRSGAVVNEPQATDPVTRATLLDWHGGYHFMQPSCFFRRSAWERAGPLREDLYFSMDLDLWLKMSEFCNFARIDVLLSSALSHENAKTTSDNTLMQAEQTLLFMEHGERGAAMTAINRLAAELAVAKEHLRLVRRSPVYQVLVYPFIRSRVKALKRYWQERARRFSSGTIARTGRLD